jgi:hypothetical protein
MNRKNFVLAMAALLGIFLLASTCGVALAASPKFYVKVDNRTDYPIKIKWHFSTRDGSQSAQDQIATIASHTTQRFSGPPGYGRFHYKYHTGGQGSPIQGYHVDAVTDPSAAGAIVDIKYTGQGFKSNKRSSNDDF